MADRHTIGLIINPIAGMGGKVALKGTDGADTLAAARTRGAKPEAREKTERALRVLKPAAEHIRFLCAGGEMGADALARAGFSAETVYTPRSADTTSADTAEAAGAMLAHGAEALLFAGGDGTARDILDAAGDALPVIGIPAGVKIQSAVFALTPQDAGAVLSAFVRGEPVPVTPREVVDLDEDAYRTGRVHAKLYGTMRVLNAPERLQSVKQGGFLPEADAAHGTAAYIAERMERDRLYAVGSGTSAKWLSAYLHLPYELLGVDVIKNGETVATDVTEEALYGLACENRMSAVVTPIGGQGFLFGRGNHQFSARVLKKIGKEHIIVVAPQNKLTGIPDHTLHVDTGDEAVNESLRGYYKILCGYGHFHMMRCK